MKKNVVALTLAFALAVSGLAPAAQVKAEGLQKQAIGIGGAQERAIENNSDEKAVEMQLNQDYSVELGEGEHAWYKFVPEEDGSYVFTSSGDEVDTYARLYFAGEELAEDDDGGSSSNFRLKYNLEAGKTYYLDTYECNEKAVSFSVNVKKGVSNLGIESSNMESAAEMQFDQDYDVVLDNGEHAYYKLVPEEEGIYIVSSSGSADTYGNLYSEDGRCIVSDDDGMDRRNFRIKYNLEAEKTYYLEACEFLEEAASFSVSARRKWENPSKESALEMQLNKNYSVDLEYDAESETSEHAWYKFVPEEEGTYQFSSNGSVYGKLYSPEGEELIAGDSYRFNIKYNLEAGKTYYLEVYEPEGGSASSSVIVKKKISNMDKENALEVQPDQEYDAELETSEHAWYKFVPEKEGIYIFSSSGDNDTYGKLYSAENDEMLASNDDGGTGYNFQIRYYLEAGKAYYLEAYGYSDEAAAFSVNVKEAEAEGLEIFYDRSDISVDYGKSVTLKVTAVTSTGEEITYQWYKTGDTEDEKIEGAKSSSYVVQADNAQRNYCCRVACGEETATAYFTIDIQTGLTAGSTIGDSASSDGSARYLELQYKEAITLSVTAAGGLTSPRYQWYEYDEDNDGRVEIKGATESSYALDGTKSATFDCEVTDGVAVKVISFEVWVNTDFTASTDSGEEYNGASNYRVVKAKSGKPVTFAITASSKAPLKYEWSKYDEASDENIPVGCTESSYTLSEAADGRYQCHVTDGIGRRTFYFNVFTDIDFQWNASNYTLTVSGTGVLSNKIFPYIGWYDDSMTSKLNVVIENGITGIEARTFCWNAEDDYQKTLYDITIPDSVVNIGEKAVGYYTYSDEDGDNVYVVSDNCTIHCEENTAAHKYAVDNDINYELMTLVDIKNFDISLKTDSAVYTGGEIMPQVVVKDGGKTLTEGTDYKLSYTNNIKAGDAAEVTVIGIGDYTGSVKKTFRITGKALVEAGVNLAESNAGYTGAEIKPQVVVKDGEKKLTAGTDYEVSYKNNINAGNAAEVTVTGKGNYTGSVKKTFRITAKALTGAAVTLTPSSFVYSGKDCIPGVAVTLSGRQLKAGADYSVSYKNNRDIGTATVTITGKNNYSGNITKSFVITVKNGNTYTVGAYKYKIVNSSEVSFAGLKSKKTTKVNIPKTVKIGGKNFKVTSIAAKALRKTNVTSVTVGNNVKTIGNSAFEGCSKLTKVTVGTGVTNIGNSAFQKCKKLGTITVKSTKLKKVGKKAFSGIKSTAKIKVPSKKLKDYKKLMKGKGQGRKVKITK